MGLEKVKQFLYSKMILKGGQIAINFIVSTSITFLTMEPVANVLCNFGFCEFDADKFAVTMTGTLMALIAMALNFGKNDGAGRVTEDLAAIKKKLVSKSQ